MGKIIKLTESQLRDVVTKIINEQSLGQSYQQGQLLSIKNQSGVAQAKAVRNLAISAFKGAKQTVVKIANAYFTIVIYGGATIWLIGKGIYKVTQAVSDALLKLIASTGKAVISAGQAVAQGTVAVFKAAGVMVEKGAQAVTQYLTSMKDSSIIAAKWLINSCKALGAAVWGKMLIGVGTIKQLSGALGGWAKQQYSTIAKSLGVAWDTAVNAASKGYDAFKQGVSNVANKISDTSNKAYNTVKQGASNFANRVANTAGQFTQGAENFMSNLFEMVERWAAMDGMNHSQILNESQKYYGKIIL
jgi:hypothetical protein